MNALKLNCEKAGHLQKKHNKSIIIKGTNELNLTARICHCLNGIVLPVGIEFWNKASESEPIILRMICLFAHLLTCLFIE